MKLNLLPQTVSKASKSRSAIIGSVLLALLGIAGMILMMVVSNGQLQKAKAAEADLRPKAQKVVDIAAEADTIMNNSAGVVRNSMLARDMIGSVDKQINLYNKVLSYMPPFFRVTQISSSAVDETVATVRVQGVINNFQDYANLMVALLRIPGVNAVGRTGFIDNLNVVPALTETDQIGRPRPAGSQTPIPDNGLERLAYYQSLGTVSTYQSIGGFGDPDQRVKLAGPDASLIDITLNINANLQVPDIRGSLNSTPGAAPAGAPATGMPPGMPPMPGMPGETGEER